MLSVLGAMRNAVDALEMAGNLLEVSYISVLNWLSRFVDLAQEPQTVGLVNDFCRFVIGFFEVIGTSAPHIYHSALLLSPKTSCVWKLYGPQANPMARVIKGMPTSWDLSIANGRCCGKVECVAWSPCSKFIAIAHSKSSEVAIHDATTLEQLHTLQSENSNTIWGSLQFSPDGCLLAGYPCYINQEECIASWDLQTGGLVNHITTDGLCHSITYSECGMMLGGYFPGSKRIIIYNILSGTQIFFHPIIIEHIMGDIWTHGEYIRYAIMKLRSITIWEVSFTSSHAPIQIETLPTPDNFPAKKPKTLVFLPTLSLLAFVVQGRIFVWDAQCQKALLDSPVPAGRYHQAHFTPDGQFFIFRTGYCKLCLYKKSPDGYLPHHRLLPSSEPEIFIISPDGGSIISSDGQMFQLLHTNSLPSLQRIPLQTQRNVSRYLEFLPDESSVATADSNGTITILDLKSANSQTVTDVDMEIYGFGVIGSKTIVVGDRCIIWELPAGNYIFGTKWNVDHSIQTITFEEDLESLQISISPNLDYMVGADGCGLAIFNMYTGERLDAVHSGGYLPGFTPDGDGVWCAAYDGEVHQWGIIKDEISSTIKLGYLGSIRPLIGFPWHSSCGYQVTNDGWVFSSSGRRLLWLPHQWRCSASISGLA